MFEKGLKLDPENAECKEGLQKVMMDIYMGSSASKEDQEERAKRAMQDPEI